MAALVGVRSTVGKTAATGPITINQADYSTPPQQGDQIWSFLHVARGGSSGGTGLQVSTLELNSNPFGWTSSGNGYNDWGDYDELNNGWVSDNPAAVGATTGTIYYYHAVMRRLASGTSADNVTWIPSPQAADNITCFSVCHVVLSDHVCTPDVDLYYQNQTVYGSAEQQVQQFYDQPVQTGNGALYTPAQLMSNSQFQSVVSTTQCRTNTVPGDITTAFTSYYGGPPPTGNVAVLGTNLICVFLGEATFGTAVTYSGMSSSLNLIYNSGNGFVVAGEFVTDTTLPYRELTWGAARRSWSRAMNFTPNRAKASQGNPGNLISSNRSF